MIGCLLAAVMAIIIVYAQIAARAMRRRAEEEARLQARPVRISVPPADRAAAREEMLFALYCQRGFVFEIDVLGFYGEKADRVDIFEDFYRLEEERRRAWLDRAAIEWLDVLQDLLADPPTHLQSWTFQDDDWMDFRYDAAQLLADWIDRDPAVLLRVGVQLEETTAPREDIYRALRLYRKPAALPILVAHVSRINEMTDEEAIELVDAMANNAAPAEAVLPILRQMQEITPSERTRVVDALERCLNRPHYGGSAAG